MAAPTTAPMAAPTDAPAEPSTSSFLGVQNKLRTAEAAPSADESLLFTPWQHALLQEAKRGYSARPSGGVSDASKVPAIREISLGGILYRAPQDWTIYLNRQRVTPLSIPEQVLDLKVAGDNIHIKWFDSQTNLIFPVVLHPNQRFNLDARIFLPGVNDTMPVATQ